jgi:hypothetical protein
VEGSTAGSGAGGACATGRASSSWAGSSGAGGSWGAGASDTGELLLDCRVEGTRHPCQGELGRERQVRVRWRCRVGEGGGGEADEVLIAIRSDGRVNGELDRLDCRDIDRGGVGNWLEEGLWIGNIASVRFGCKYCMMRSVVNSDPWSAR